ncbi:Hexokinase-1 [Yarrowia sp. C11]|nr:Hexokinase-1 [Yarrowia sp. C11]KAG5370589.1 Hexokinase-1 [Yarrowia sp. E02]
MSVIVTATNANLPGQPQAKAASANISNSELLTKESHLMYDYERYVSRNPSSFNQKVLDNLRIHHIYSRSSLDTLVAEFLAEIAPACANKDAPSMLPSKMGSLPNDSLSGSVLSIDIGGSTLRGSMVDLEKMTVCDSVQHLIPDTVKNYSGSDFFDWIVERIMPLVQDVDGTIPIGLSWSFPIFQPHISQGLIQTMGKGYGVADEIINQDLKELFESHFASHGKTVEVGAILNDSVASLVAANYISKAHLCLILGTGINVSALLPKQQLPKTAQDQDKYIVNCEASLFGQCVSKTCWDLELDEALERPGFQPLESLTSGRYIGEICRLILRDLSRTGFLSRPEVGPYELTTAEVAELETAASGEVDYVQDLVVATSDRSAALASAIITAIYKLTGSDNESPTITYDGTMVQKYPNFRLRMQQRLKEQGLNVTFVIAEDGPVFGSAIACATQLSL